MPDQARIEKVRALRARAEIAARTNIESASARAYAEWLATEAFRLQQEIEREQFEQDLAQAATPKETIALFAELSKAHGKGKTMPAGKGKKPADI
jgi:hypothetical protein